MSPPVVTLQFRGGGAFRKSSIEPQQKSNNYLQFNEQSFSEISFDKFI